MVSALLKALTLLKERTFWRVLWLSLLITIASFIALYSIVWAILAHVSITDIWWLNTLVDVLGGLAVLVLTWLLFPAVATLVISFFLDRVVEAVERQYYPHLPPPMPLSRWQSLAGGLRFAIVLLGVNLIALPLYLIPGLNVVVFYTVNAYLLGREYFELVALRRLDPRAAQGLRRSHRLRFFIAGLLMAALFTIPIVNLLASLIAAAFMVHLVIMLTHPNHLSATLPLRPK
jgi:CysZ protein